MRFVDPDSDRIDLQDGPDGSKNWIDVKKLLSAGDETRYRTAAFKNVSATAEGAGAVGIDWEAMAFARALAYLVDWSAVRNGKKVPISRSALEALHPDDFKEIDQAILAHIDKMAAEKNALSGTPTSISPAA